ncbi:MAG: hypothetical protein HY000_13035 [Planctomycetes bacterium]|nr:hypothetical protein [Planctomycetota bacterium]
MPVEAPRPTLPETLARTGIWAHSFPSCVQFPPESFAGSVTPATASPLVGKRGWELIHAHHVNERDMLDTLGHALGAADADHHAGAQHDGAPPRP